MRPRVVAAVAAVLCSGAAAAPAGGQDLVHLSDCNTTVSTTQQWDHSAVHGIAPGIALAACLYPANLSAGFQVGSKAAVQRIAVGHCLGNAAGTDTEKKLALEELWHYDEGRSTVELRPGAARFCVAAGQRFDGGDISASSTVYLAACGSDQPPAMMQWDWRPADRTIRPKAKGLLCLTAAAPSPAGGGGGGSSGVSGGGVFLILFFCGGAVYLVAGAAYNHFKKGERGVGVIPNKDFWTDLPLLCKDGAVFAAHKVRGAVGGGGYSTV